MYVQIINDRMRLWADDDDLDLPLRGAADAVNRITERGARVIPPAVLVPLDAAALAALHDWAIAAGIDPRKVSVRQAVAARLGEP